MPRGPDHTPSVPEMAIAAEIELPVQPQVVWNELEQIENHVIWMADAEQLIFSSEQRTGIGTEIVVTTKVGPFRTRDHIRFTEWEPPMVMGVEHRGVFTGSGRFTLEPLGTEGTRLTWIEQIRFPWYLAGHLGAFFARPVLRRIWGRDLKRLRARLSGR